MLELWQKDPVTGIKSVSLTLGMLTTVILVAVGILQVFGKVQNVGPFTEMFWGAWALYFGRRFNINGKTYSSDKIEEVEKALEK